MFIFPVHVYSQIPSYHGEIFFQNVFKIYSYETLFSFNYNSYKEKKKQHAWFGKAYFEKYLSKPPVITWVSSSVAPFTPYCMKMFNNSE